MKKILIVDDEQAIRSMLRVILKKEDRQFFEAQNGLKAQKILQEENCDLVLSDVIMPDCDGIELVMAIRHKYPSLPVVIMSGGGRVNAEHYLMLAKKLGALRVFEKPFDSVALRAAVDELLADEEQEKE
jgi:DNA-binding NtrC family response regulator